MAEPPFDAEADQLTNIEPLATGIAVTPVGSSGTTSGTAAAEADEAELVPILFVAVTVKV